MRKIFLSLILFALTITANAQESHEPIIEHRADRVLIFPQRMELADDVSVMDLLAMYPEILSRNYDDIIDRYQIRVENLNHEADMRVFLTTLKAKYVDRIQICDNPDVMKGRKNLGGVIDINMVRGAEEKDIYIGLEADTKNRLHFPIFNAVYGNGKTDLLVTTSLYDQSLHGNYDATARYHAKVNHAANDRHNYMFDVMGHYSHSNLDGAEDSRFHGTQFQYDGVFNEKGTMLTVDLGYEYYDDGYAAHNSPLPNNERNREMWQIYIMELNTPIADGLDLCLGWEGDYADTKIHHNQQLNLATSEKEQIQTAFSLKSLPDDFSVLDKFRTYNNDAYIQFDYSTGPLSLTLGDRVMFYHYDYHNDINANSHSRNSPYNLVVVSAILQPTWQHQVQASYYRRFVTPNSYDTHNYLHFDTYGRTIITGNTKLDYQPADVYRLSYTFNKDKFLTSVIAHYIDTHDVVVDIEDTFNGVPVFTWTNDNASCSITSIDFGATYTQGIFTLTTGASFYGKHVSGGGNINYGYLRLNPILRLNDNWRIDFQALYCSKNSPEKLLTDTNVYGMFSVQKSIGAHLTLSAQWHDVFCKDLSAANFRLLYYF